MKRLNGFSLMEMMVVLVIVAVIAVAGVPMVNKKMLNAASEKSPWIWTGLNNKIAYNIDGNSKQTASIGAMNNPESASNARLYIESKDNTPFVAFKKASDNKSLKLNTNTSSIALTEKNSLSNNAITIGFDTGNKDSSVVIGTSAKAGDIDSTAIGYKAIGALNSVAIGSNATVSKSNTVAIGYKATPSEENSVVIGSNSSAINKNSVAIGKGANTTGENTIAIGSGANTTGKNAIAIGTDVSAKENEIVIGGKGQTVKILGNVIIGDTSTPSYLAVNGDIASRNTIIGVNLVGRKYYGDSNGNGDATVGHLTYNLGEYLFAKEKKYTEWDVWKAVTSDRRLKNVGENFGSGLKEIKKLEVFNYTYKKDPNKTPRVGVIAQDLQKIFPNAVFKGEDGFLRIRMEDMFYSLVNAVKELDAKIETIKNTQIAQLFEKINILEKQNKQQEELIEKLIEQNKELEKRIQKLEK